MNFNLYTCYLGSQSKKTIYLLGNSHANHYRETAFLLHKNHDIGVFSITTGWCNFPLDPRQMRSKDCSYPPGKIQLQKEVGAYLLENVRKDDIVIISNRYPIYHSSKNFWLEDEISIQLINNLFDKLSAKGVELVLALPTPEFEVASNLCAKQWYRPNPSEKCQSKRGEILDKQSAPRRLLKNFLNPEILVYDPLPVLCQEACLQFDESGNKLFIDNNHLTDYANANLIYPSILKILQL